MTKINKYVLVKVRKGAKIYSPQFLLVEQIKTLKEGEEKN